MLHSLIRQIYIVYVDLGTDFSIQREYSGPWIFCKIL